LGGHVITPLDAALRYAARLPVFPVGVNKKPLVDGGFHAATKDETQIRQWWRRWPGALISAPTGISTGIAVLDVDVKTPGANGWDSLEELGVVPLPDTPIAHTPSGGAHIYFDCFWEEIPTSIAKIGRSLDVRGERSSIILPTPGSRYVWDSRLNFKTVELHPAPAWLIPPNPVAANPTKPVRLPPAGGISEYAACAVNGAVRDIYNAAPGRQAITLNREAFSIGGLVGSGHLPERDALEALLCAALAMPSYDLKRPWRHREVERSVRASFEAGIRSPRHGR
jgi:hypothetical protein